MVESSTSVAMPAARPAAAVPWRASDAGWPPSTVSASFPLLWSKGYSFLVILIPFVLTIWISLLKWRANRPFETARFSGIENYESVLGNDQFWLALGRTFYFAGGRPWSTGC